MLGEFLLKNEDIDEEDPKIKLDYSFDYKNLISLLLGSLYVSFESQAFSHADVTSRLTKDASQVDAAEFPDETVQFQNLESISLGHLKRKGSSL